LLGQDRELDLALLDKEDRIRRIPLRKDNLVLSTLQGCSSAAYLCEKDLGVEPWGLFARYQQTSSQMRR
jgi:hypothetical protein